MEHAKVYLTARIWLAIFVAVIALSLALEHAAADVHRRCRLLRRVAERICSASPSMRALRRTCSTTGSIRARST